MVESNSVFISYRRTAAEALALAVWQDLNYNGFDAFYDIENIVATQFDTVILNQIAARPYFMPILTPGTLERCKEPGDWVLREYQEAIRLNRVIIPLHTPQFNFADLDDHLPPEVASHLKRWSFVETPYKFLRLILRDIRERYLKPISIEVTNTPSAEVAAIAHSQAVAAAAPVVTESQLSAQEYYEHAEFHADNGNWDAVIANTTEAIRLKPDFAAAFTLRGVAYGNKGDLDQVIQNAEQALKLDPQQYRALNIRGVVRRIQGDLQAALRDYNAVLIINPRYAEAYNNRAVVYAAMGDYVNAIIDNEKFLELRPFHPQASVVRANVASWRKLAKTR